LSIWHTQQYNDVCKDTCAIRYPVEWLKIQLIFIFGWNSKGTQNRIGLQKVQNKVNW